MWIPLLPVATADSPAQFNHKVEIETRTRLERRLDRDFDAVFNDNRTDLLSRVRVGVNWTYGKNVSGVVQYQYAHDLAFTSRRNFSTENSDLFQANVKFARNKESVTVGRQRIAVGSERLIGALDWVNTGRTFDAIRYQTPQLDVFAGRIGVAIPRPRDARIAAGFVKTAPATYGLIFKHDESTTGDIDLFTFTTAYRRPLGKLTELEFEGAYQWGRNQGRDHDAWAIHAQINQKVNPRITAFAEWNAASGGGDAGTNRTFDNLYPTNHKFYGLMDLHAWRNLDMLALGLTYKARPDMDVKLRYATSRLRDPSDSWYAAGGAPNRWVGGAFRDPSGQSGRHLGEEFDVEWVYRASSTRQVSAGIGWFKPGSFVRNVSGASRTQVYGFVQYSVRF